MMYEASQQLHDILNAYLSIYVPCFVKIQPILMEPWAAKATKVCYIQNQVSYILTSLGSPAWPRDHCSSDRNAQARDIFTLWPVMPCYEYWNSSGHLKGSRNENQEHIKRQAKILVYTQIPGKTHHPLGADNYRHLSVPRSASAMQAAGNCGCW